jgi:YHS domain-containing protein
MSNSDPKTHSPENGCKTLNWDPMQEKMIDPSSMIYKLLFTRKGNTPNTYYFCSENWNFPQDLKVFSETSLNNLNNSRMNLLLTPSGMIYVTFAGDSNVKYLNCFSMSNKRQCADVSNVQIQRP